MKYYYELTAIHGNMWNIYDPNKNYICSVYSKHEAEKLLLHLNKHFLLIFIYKKDKHMGG